MLVFLGTTMLSRQKVGSMSFKLFDLDTKDIEQSIIKETFTQGWRMAA